MLISAECQRLDSFGAVGQWLAERGRLGWVGQIPQSDSLVVAAARQGVAVDAER
jgi:hypothetical protein